MAEFAIHMVLALINMSIKNPAKKAELQKDLLMLRDEISALYPGA